MATTSLGAGCILALTMGMMMRMARQISRFQPERMVSLMGTASVSVPPVFFTTASVRVARSRGMEPDRPACQTTKPE